MSHVEAIQSNYKVLLRCTTINFYVTDSLRAKYIINDVQESDLRAERSHLRQRILLFQWLKEVSSDRYESFLKVMKDTEQEHVANLLRGSTDENHLPLSNARYERLEKIRPKLAKVTRTDTEVLAGLRRLDAISYTDDDEIRAEKVEYVKSSKLISAIMRRSNHSYNSFQEVLRKTLQDTAAEYLNEGEIPAVHLNNKRPDLDGPLSLALNGVIKNQKSDDAEIKEHLASLNGLSLNLVQAVPGQSIIIFIYCKTIDNAITFMQLFNSGRLHYILGRILNRLLLTIEPHGTEDLHSRISLEDDDIISLEEFTGLEGFVIQKPYRPNPLHKPRRHDAAAQTDEHETLKTSTERPRMRPRPTRTKPLKQGLILLPYSRSTEDIYGETEDEAYEETAARVKEIFPVTHSDSSWEGILPRIQRRLQPPRPRLRALMFTDARTCPPIPVLPEKRRIFPEYQLSETRYSRRLGTHLRSLPDELSVKVPVKKIISDSTTKPDKLMNIASKNILQGCKMAEVSLSGDDIKEVELNDITTCCICTEVYTDPKALPCFHTFCLKCIQETGLKTNKGPGDEMPCPICRRLFKIPAEGFTGLPKHFFIERLIQVSKLPDRSAVSRALCSVCSEKKEDQEGKNTPAAYRNCVECKRKLCETCCSEHTQDKLTRNHNLQPITEDKGDQSVVTYLASNLCEQHKQMVLDVFCADCKTVECAICFIDDHRNHEGSHVSKYVDEFRKQIKSNREAINKCKDKAQLKKTKILLVKKDIQERVGKLERDIANRRDELKQLIDKHASSLLESLCSAKQVKLKEIQITKDDVETYISCLETYSSYCQKIMAKGSVSDICGAFSDLARRAKELQQQCQPTIDKDIQSISFRFRKSELEEFLVAGRDNLVGEYEGNEKKSLDAEEKLKQELNENEHRMAVLTQKKLKILAELRYKLDPVLVHTIDTNPEKKKKQWFRTESKSKRIGGMSILDKELFVLSEQSSEVEVYDSMDCNLRRLWKLRELIDPRDIVSCERNKCLFIINSKEVGVCEILRVNPSGKLIKKWSDQDDSVRSLSVTYESNVILVNLRKSTIKEYSPDGQLIRKINLSPDTFSGYLLHAVKLINGDFVISHRSLFDGGVCIVDADGNLKKSFREKRGSSIDHLSDPVYLSVDANGFVMVADQLNDRILSLDSDLKFKKEILSKEKHGLRCPYQIILDEINGRLFVADNESDNQRILVFDFK